MIARPALRLPRQLIQRRDLLRELVVRELKDRYKRSVAGLVWSLLNPLAQWLILSFVFGLLVPSKVPHYSSFVFIGVLAWSWFQTSLAVGAGAITEHRSLIRYPGFPATVLPAVTVATNLIHFLLALPVLLVVLLGDGVRLSGSLLLLPLIIGLQFLLLLSLVNLVAAVNVIFRDTQHLLYILLILLFYLTPVFYDLSALPADLRGFFYLNPMTILLDAYRAVLIQGSLPQPTGLGLVAVGALVALWLTHRLVARTSLHFVEDL